MKGRHNLRRRFSLQPSFMKDDSPEDKHKRDKVHRHDTEDSLSSSNVRHKIVVMGAARTGKTSLITQFLYSRFSPKYKRTVEEMHQGAFSISGVNLTLDILDTSGANEFPAMRALSMSSADAFILVYDVTDSSTFDEARVIRDQIHETKATTAVPIVVVGNKIDLLEDKPDAREFPAMRALSMSSADAFILVYDVTDSSTFDEARVIRDQIHETKATTAVPIVVVGNKIDLLEDKPDARELDFDTTESLVNVDWENGFVEASAKNNENVTQIFKELLVQAKITYNLSPALRRRRRQSLPPNQGGGSPVPPSSAPPSTSHVPSAAQLQHLQQIQERSIGGKRNSCILS